jgi:hypothetical protein
MSHTYCNNEQDKKNLFHNFILFSFINDFANICFLKILGQKIIVFLQCSSFKKLSKGHEFLYCTA